MANTQGLPDEVLPDLLSPTPTPSVRPRVTAGAGGGGGGGSSSSGSRADRIRRRDAAMRAQRERQQQQIQQQQVEATATATADGSIVGEHTSAAGADIGSPASRSVGGANPSRPSGGQQEQKRAQQQQQRRRNQPAFRLHPSRAEMMESWSGEGGGGPPPSATVIRSSRPPTVRTKADGGGSTPPPTAAPPQPMSAGGSTEVAARSTTEEEEVRPYEQQEDQDQTGRKQMKPVIKSESIRERPVNRFNRSTVAAGGGPGPNDDGRDKTKRPSRFMQKRTTKKEGATEGGFPSLDFPVGTFAGNNHQRRGGKAGGRGGAGPPPPPDGPARVDLFALGSGGAKKRGTTRAAASGGGAMPDSSDDATAGVSGMTRSEVMESLAEIESALSPESIAFLKERGRRKKEEAKAKGKGKAKGEEATEEAKEGSAAAANPSGVVVVASGTNAKTGNGSIDETEPNKEKEAAVLSSIRTEEDLDRAFREANPERAAGAVSAAAADGLDSVDAAEGKIGDLEAAASLLRSTSYRQNVLAARSACELLEERVAERRRSEEEEGSEQPPADATSFPPLLPVALRCLLDLPQPYKHRQLHSYVLRSIHSLAVLFAHPSHRILGARLDDFKHHAASVYQLNFMDDDVPLPPAASCYARTASPPQKVESPDGKPSAVDGALYATDSSAVTAAKDGAAFYADPLWTLLSRMRLLPCLSAILASAGEGRAPPLPGETTAAVCGILAMLAARSPGAACAIAQHKTIVPSVVATTLEPGGCSVGNGGEADESKESKDEPVVEDGIVGRPPNWGGFVVDASVALPSLVLLCTLARQSRTVASETEPFAAVVPHLHAILGMAAESEAEWSVQRWCLILWRTLLRYGLAIPHLPTFISLATSHLSTKGASDFSLAPEYLSAFANVCQCAKVVTRSTPSSPESAVRLTAAQAETLAMAGVWLSPHVKQCAAFLGQIGQCGLGGEEDATSTQSEAQLASARLRLLFAYTSASAPADFRRLASIEEDAEGAKTNSPGSAQFVSVVPRESCLLALESVLKSGIVERMLNMILRYAFVMDWVGVSLEGDERGDTAVASLEEESSACSFLVGFVSLLTSVSKEDTPPIDDTVAGKESRSAASLASEFNSMVLKSLRSRPSLCSRASSKERFPLARAGWLDAAHYSICKFLSMLCASQPEVTPRAVSELREFAFCIVGRLQLGNEAMAAVLLSQDVLFRVSSATDGVDTETTDASSLQAMLLRELCNSKRAQVQLDHSFKLHRGHGITSAGLGPFGLESLRSDADFIEPPTIENQDDASEPLIPLGKCWLWQVLSSTISPPHDVDHQQRAQIMSDASAVLVSCLRLLNSLEGDYGNALRYVGQVNPGTKLYHLCNACLFPEEVIRNDKFGDMFVSLFERYAESDLTSDQPMCTAFVKACFQHSLTGRSKKNAADDSDTDKEQERVLSLFDTGTVSDSGVEGLQPREVRAFNDFVGDMCTAYLEYGAQYNALNHCIRFLLRPGFPSTARADLLLRLRDLLHLLTFEEEIEDPSGEAMVRSLGQGLSGGLSSRDGSRRDPAEVIDTLAAALCGDRRLEGGYIYLLTVASIARNLASSLQRCESGLEASRRRMDKLSEEASIHVFNVALRLLRSSEGAKQDLIAAVLDVCAKNGSLVPYGGSWDEVTKSLQKASCRE